MIRLNSRKKVGIFAIIIGISAFFAGGLVGCSDPKVEAPKLIADLYSPETRVRSQAALKLSRIGPPHANPATGRLIQLLNDPNAGVQSAAAVALRKIGSPEALAALE